MRRVNFLSAYLNSHKKMKLTVNTCKKETKLNCEEKCVLVVFNMNFL